MPKTKGLKHNFTRKNAKKLKNKPTLKFKKKSFKKKKTYKRKCGGSDSSNDTQTSLLQKALLKTPSISSIASLSSLNNSDNSDEDLKNLKNKTKSNIVVIPDPQGHKLTEKNRKALTRIATYSQASQNQSQESPIIPENKNNNELVKVYSGKDKNQAKWNAIKDFRNKPTYLNTNSYKQNNKSKKYDIWYESDLDDPFNLKSHPYSENFLEIKLKSKLNNMNITMLRSYLTSQGLSDEGDKSELKERLFHHMMNKDVYGRNHKTPPPINEMDLYTEGGTIDNTKNTNKKKYSRKNIKNLSYKS